MTLTTVRKITYYVLGVVKTVFFYIIYSRSRRVPLSILWLWFRNARLNVHSNVSRILHTTCIKTFRQVMNVNQEASMQQQKPVTCFPRLHLFYVWGDRQVMITLLSVSRQPVETTLKRQTGFIAKSVAIEVD